MRLLIPTLAFLILLAGCNRYQYLGISSDQLQKNEHQEFTIENDTLQMVYNFNGQNAPVNLLVRNKLDKPIFIDWKRSALIINDNAISYSPDQVSVHGVVSASSISWTQGFSATDASVYGTANLPPGIQMIPPQSFITKTPLGITNKLLKNIPDSALRKIKMHMADGNSAYADQAFFDAGNSPLRFRSYLAIVVGDSTLVPVAYQHSFYISEVYRTGLNPKKFAYNREKAGEWAYVQEVTGFGKSAAVGFGVLAGAAVLTTEAWAESKNNQPNRKN
ncbi:hypothetical protein D3H65_14670 [Paraflavitalea soli]|uniref:Uncharacterized protein n=1 Tax=Paraflavitalea soli TaxID=2315862 RepID=A0A3B7MQ85_9BACT|nr:hypothetical protein [Paraflavitalea soli]AXY75146.1 hypothetical protein D3H65_14670 [Paraflavitalea soli]